MGEKTPARIALVGNPRSGKSSLLETLTGGHAPAVREPGTSVAPGCGTYSHCGELFDIVELPGAYSLTSHSPEEHAVQEELLGGTFGVVVVVVDTTALRRSLVLLAQVMALGARPVLCLNVSDDARARGQELDVELLERLLGMPVVETVGHRGIGTELLRQAIVRAHVSPRARTRPALGARLERAVARISERLAQTELRPETREWVALKLLMGERIPRQCGAPPALHESGAGTFAAAQRDRFESLTGTDIALLVAQGYLAFVDELLAKVVRRGARPPLPSQPHQRHDDAPVTATRSRSPGREPRPARTS